jgi:transposase InsO family protein
MIVSPRRPASIFGRSNSPGPWRSLEAVEFATLAWVDWFNTRRLLEPIGYLPPAEYEARYYQQAAVA